MPASGRRVSWDAIQIFTWENGKATGRWIMADTLAMLTQMGATPQRGQ